MRFTALSALSGALVLLSGGTPVEASSPTKYKVQTPPLDTPWTYKVGTNPWPDHPRPQLERKAWKNLNGIWTYRKAESQDDMNTLPTTEYLDSEIMVPSCVESALSGIQDTNVTYMWYKTRFDVPSYWDNSEKIMLNFEAVDYQATVFVNGKNVGNNTGGYFRFTIDVTDAVKRGKQNDLVVFVHDPTDTETIPVGKQTVNPSHIFYRSCSGIWQTVWLESTAADHITQLDVVAAADGTVTVKAHSAAQKGAKVTVTVLGKNGKVVATGKGTADKTFTFKVSSPKVWSPDSPTLYDLAVTLDGKDEVSSYIGFRTIELGKVDGVVRPMLNGEFHFLFSTLDQGFWPDGIYLAPNYEAMIFDLKMLKDLGFNMVRKHIKVEPDLFYRACDELGMMIMQDMPSLPASKLPNADEQAEFNRQYEILVNQQMSYTCMIAYVIYNEGWGQTLTPPYPEGPLTAFTRELDPSRLINSVTGWHDHHLQGEQRSDFSDNHHYANPQCGTPFYSIASSPYDPTRIGFQGEFGGIGANTTARHLWKVEEAVLTVNQTYEINENLDAWNYRASVLFNEFREQIERYACSGGVWTQTTDVEGEVNGLVTYDRRVQRTDKKQWRSDIQALYDAAASRGGYGSSSRKF